MYAPAKDLDLLRRFFAGVDSSSGFRLGEVEFNESMIVSRNQQPECVLCLERNHNRLRFHVVQTTFVSKYMWRKILLLNDRKEHSIFIGVCLYMHQSCIL